ncbi:hypothetical protein [Paraburkholderia sp. DGU8]|uniref:hypothetical protein n=1 Tax=Paraburkholderia sp. DGU8 TaxID=3161997 RepID=UPI0034651A90
MPAGTLARAMTAIAFFGVVIYTGASTARAGPQANLTAPAPNGATAAGHLRVHAKPAEQGIDAVLKYSTDITAVVTDAYGLGALGVLPVGPFIFTRRQMGCRSETDGRSSANCGQTSPANALHVTFVWPAT